MAREKTKCMTSIGGQALIEGIMMRGPQKTAVAVRLPDKTIETEYLEIKTLRDKYPLFRAPLLRGIAGFIDSLSLIHIFPVSNSTVRGTMEQRLGSLFLKRKLCGKRADSLCGLSLIHI